MGILGFGGRRVQQRATIEPQHKYEHSHCDSTRRDRGKRNKQQYLSRFNRFKLHTDNTRWSIPIFTTLPWARRHESDGNPESNRGYKRNRHNKYLYPVVLCLSQLAIVPATLAENVGGVSATAAPVANSSGSVTNQAIQVLQGPYITNTYGDGISCQGPTLNVTPYVTRSYSWQFPFESHYQDPVYNMLDLEGDFDADGNAIGDGIPDKPGDILYYRDIRTGQKDNYNWNAGFSATISWPLDRKQQQLCKEAAQAHNELRSQILSNRRLEFELTRLTKCGEMAQKGISFASWSPYYRLCQDVVVQNKNAIAPHVHMLSLIHI